MMKIRRMETAAMTKKWLRLARVKLTPHGKRIQRMDGTSQGPQPNSLHENQADGEPKSQVGEQNSPRTVVGKSTEKMLPQQHGVDLMASQ